MAENCPYCEARLPPVRDGFCPECRQALDEAPALADADDPPGSAPTRPPARPLRETLSLPARIVIVLSVLLAAGGTVAYVFWAIDSLPAGRYPLWFFALPVVAAVGVLCAVGLGVMRVCGVPISRTDATDERDP
jgi:hypothetical protein